MTAPSDLGKRPELAWLPVGKLKADPRYQRSLETRRGQALIERIAAGFRWSAFQAILCMKVPRAVSAGQDYWLVLDGQHRVEAARRRKIERVPAVVVASVSLEEQAAAFVQANRDRVAVTPFALHHANLLAADPAAQAIDRVCRKAAVWIPRYPLPAEKLKPGETLALGTIGLLIKRHGEALAALALGAVARGHSSRRGELRAPIFAAVAAVLVARPEEDRADAAKAVTAAIARSAPAAIQAGAIQRRATHGGSYEQAVEHVLRGLLRSPAETSSTAKTPSPPRSEIARPERENELGALAASPAAPKRKAFPHSTGALPPAARPQDEAAIAEHLAQKGARRIEAELDVDAVMNECRKDGFVVVARGGAFQEFTLDGVGTVDRKGLLERANKSRRARGLPAWPPEQVRWVRPPPPESPQQKKAREIRQRRGIAMAQGQSLAKRASA